MNRCYGCRASTSSVTGKYGGTIEYRCTLQRDPALCKAKIRTYAQLLGTGERQVWHSTDLDLWYKPRMIRGTLHLIFEDGTDYTIWEALHIATEGIEGDDLRALHAIKRSIGGRILPDRGMWPTGRYKRLVARNVRRQAPHLTEAVE